MPHQIHIWIKDSQDGNITGGSQLQNREGSIEATQFEHGIQLPTDKHTGAPTGARTHGPVVFVKHIDQASPYLFKALCTGQTLNEVVIKWYRTEVAGGEQEYFEHKLERAHVTGVETFMPDTKDSDEKHNVHMERVSLVYEKISWTYLDGNLQHEDDWLVRESVK